MAHGILFWYVHKKLHASSTRAGMNILLIEVNLNLKGYVTSSDHKQSHLSWTEIARPAASMMIHRSEFLNYNQFFFRKLDNSTTLGLSPINRSFGVRLHWSFATSNAIILYYKNRIEFMLVIFFDYFWLNLSLNGHYFNKVHKFYWNERNNSKQASLEYFYHQNSLSFKESCMQRANIMNKRISWTSVIKWFLNFILSVQEKCFPCQLLSSRSKQCNLNRKASFE